MIQELTPVQDHAIKLVVDGATSHAEDALNEDPDLGLTDGEFEDAIQLALDLAKVVGRYPHVLLELSTWKKDQ